MVNRRLLPIEALAEAALREDLLERIVFRPQWDLGSF
jgi:hypothetical protein